MVDVTPVVLWICLFWGYHIIAVLGPVWEDVDAETKVFILERLTVSNRERITLDRLYGFPSIEKGCSTGGLPLAGNFGGEESGGDFLLSHVVIVSNTQ